MTAGMGFNGSQARLPLSSWGELNPKTSPRAGAQRGFPGAESRLLGQQNVPVCAHIPEGLGRVIPSCHPAGAGTGDWGEDKVARGRLIGSRSEEVAAASLFCSASHRVSKARGLGRGFWSIPWECFPGRKVQRWLRVPAARGNFGNSSSEGALHQDSLTLWRLPG